MSFFPRGPGPLVSILLPTRGRSPHLLHAVDSVVSLARDKSCLEFIFKADTDDTETLETIEKLKSLINLKVLVSPRGRGYFLMHEWVNGMAAMATGDWLFLFNDDARMKVEDWDHVLLNIGTSTPWPGIDDVCLLLAPTIGRPFVQEFLFLRRRTYEILGHWSLSPHNDNWIHTVMDFAGCKLTTQITVDHLSHLMDDYIRHDCVEAYKTTATDTLNTPEAKKAKLRDAEKLLDFMEGAERAIVWSDAPAGPGWYWHVGNNNSIRQHCYVNDGLAAFFDDGKPVRAERVADMGGKWAPRR